jgi:Protein of unknown function (DUF3606)
MNLMLISNELAWSTPQDAPNIDLTEEADLRYWTQTLSCSSHELIHAIQAAAITAYLKSVKQGSTSARSG